jgi:two-component system response regulator YesN
LSHAISAIYIRIESRNSHVYEKEPPMRKANKHNILIVEDTGENAGYYSAILHDRYLGRVSSSGLDALKIIKSTDIDVVVLDSKLAAPSCREVLKEIYEKKPSLPVIVATEYGDEHDVDVALRAGVRQYIKKPFSCKELTAKIETCLLPNTAHQDGTGAPAGREGGRKADGRPSDAVTRNKSNIQKAVKFIDDKFATRITLDGAAAIASLSKYHFSRTFKKAVGMTYQDYLSRRRVEKAKELLRENNCTVAQAASQSGYFDVTNFERIFKNVAGVTPSGYRKLSRR